LYELLYKIAPPLRLFRVPARWLYLYAFAIAALAGMGAHRLMMENAARSLGRSLAKLLVWSAAALVPLALVQWLAVRMKEGASPQVFGAWVGLVMIAITLLCILPRVPARWTRALILLVFLGGELFAAGAFMGFNTATAPQAYDSLRPTVSQLLQDPGLYRILSIPRADFDPGDLPELKSIFGRALSKEDLYQLVVAIKHQEALSPNIPMKYRIATLDGYDGGVLPLRRYVELKELLLQGAPLREAATLRPNQADALLRDQLAGIPDTRLLGLLNVKYVITDKIGDLWVDNVYYDLSTPVYVSSTSVFTTARLPNFEATAFGLIYRLEGTGETAGPIAEVTVKDSYGHTFQGTITGQETRPLAQAGSFYVRLNLDRAYYPQELSVRYLRGEGRLVLRGISLIDGRTGANESLMLDPRLRLVHSGDLKIYENLDWQPRAFITGRAVWATDDREALALMRRREWGEVVLTASVPGQEPGQRLASDATTPQPVDTAHSSVRYPAPQVMEYRPEYVRIRAETAAPGYMV
ncbi:MAG: hypothetical protein Q8P59_02440, partial [Dehalococcoidia bacterium]|nr:hypothetical protein [Dehalococcoidia bacterium]